MDEWGGVLVGAGEARWAAAGGILLVDDDPALREVVRYALDRAGFEVVEASDGRVAIEKFGRTQSTWWSSTC